MRYVWVVTGSTGSYSDTIQWFVAAYPEEDQARLHAESAEALAKKCWAARREAGLRRDRTAVNSAADPLRRAWDPDVELGEDTVYEVHRVPLVRHVDEFKELHLGPGRGHAGPL